MTQWMRRRTRRQTIYLLSILACLAAAGVAWGGSVVQFMTAKSLPDATVDVIDPESGTSSGTTGSDVNIAVGDIILFRFQVASAPASAGTEMRGINGYITEYIPPNTVLVGARLLDANGNTVEPRPAGPAADGCRGGSLCNTWGSMATGSVAQVYSDTGIFFSTRSTPTTNPANTSPVPNNAFLTLFNGIPMSPKPAEIDPQIVQVLAALGPTWFAHNEWDYDQVQAFGSEASTNPLRHPDGNTPHGYGSPVAGPNTHYQFEVNPNGTFTGSVGPWQRVFYPGSQIGTGVGNLPATSANTRVGVATLTGQDVTPANPRAATAVRFAVGEVHVGEIRYVEVALRVTGVPIDPTFGSGGGNVNCGEVVGGEASGRSNNTGVSNPWPFYVPHPQCVFLRLKFDLTPDKTVASGGQNINYTIFGKNLAVTTENNARVLVKFVSSDQAVVSTSVPPSSTAACADDSSLTCLTFNLGTLAPSAEFSLVVTLTASGTGKRTNVVSAQYLSSELVAIDPRGFTSTAMTVVAATQLPRIALANVLDVTSNFAAAGSNTWEITGTVTNDGNDAWTSDSFTIVLPAATFGLRNAGGTAADQITVGGVNFNCTTTGIERVCTRSDTYAAGQSRAIGFRLVVPAGQAAGLYTIGIKTVGNAFETNFPKAVVVPVGAVRTVAPILDCPVAATQPSLSGVSEANAAINVKFNLISRATATANGTGNWSTSNFGAFGEMYGGLEIRATAQVSGELESELSVPCTVTTSRACSDGFDNDGDTLIDFPSDPGCESSLDNTETGAPQCSDGIDNNADGRIDWSADPSCSDLLDETENGIRACADGIDNDLDLLLDLADPDCNNDPNGVSEATLQACQNRRDDDADALVDFTPDLGCHSAFDTSEFDGGISSAALPARLLVVFDTSGSMNWNTCTDHFTGGDGSEDFPGSDVSCNQLRTTLGCRPACSDGVDSDGDSFIDFPSDTGCANADDNDETSGSAKPPAALTLCDNGLADDSRLFQVKGGISQVVANFGEVDWGLMRYTQRPTDFQPPTVNAGRPSGGWQGGGLSPCQSFDSGELLVSFSYDNPNTIIDWLDGSTNYATIPPPGLDQELRGSGTTPIAGSLQSASTYLTSVRSTDTRSCRPYRVILVTDGLETCGGDPVAAAASSFTAGFPVVVIGFSTGAPVARTALNAIARAGSGNQDDAIFVDDQQALAAAFSAIVNETLVFEVCNGLDDDCDGSVDEDFVPPLGDSCINGLLGECARTGTFQCTADTLGTVCNAPMVTPPCADETCDGCNTQDDDCDGKIDEGLTCSCLSFELCNGIDDDCDQVIDEDSSGVGGSCGTDTGECTLGTVQCVDPDANVTTTNSELQCVGGTGPAANDPCDGLDNDCDTRTDEDPGPRCYDFGDGGCVSDGAGGFTCEGFCGSGQRACVNGTLGACLGDVGAQAELCDGLDNDCDSIIDDPWMPDANNNSLGGACNNGLLGACRGDGQYVCNANNPASPTLVCNAQTRSPGAEQCNSVDDDCDGDVDEGNGTTPPAPDGLGAPVGNSCGGASGCSPGTVQCVDHDVDTTTPNELMCVTTSNGSAEVCDGLDNDCDTIIDEGVVGDGAACYPNGTAGCTPNGTGGYTCVGICAPGVAVCTPPALVCEGFVGPAQVDSCNGLDDDCDGTVDEGATCPGTNTLCNEGVCVFPCDNSEFPCPFGYFCDVTPSGNYCTPNPCADVTCPIGFECDVQTGVCEDLCAGITCNPGETCTSGYCLDCFELGCEPGSICVNNADNVGECQADPCFDVQCGNQELCRDGVCEPLDACANVACAEREVCDPATGACQSTSLCSGVFCAQGEACRPADGTCIADPCAVVSCPNNTVCTIVFDGTASCVNTEAPVEWVTVGGGGCASGTGSSGSSWILMLLIALRLRRTDKARERARARR